MKVKNFSFAIICILGSFLVSCGTKKPLIKIEPKKDSSIIAGKIDIFYNGKDVTEDATVLFNEIMLGKYAYKTDTSHILLTDLPIGEGHIARLQYKNFIINVPKEKSSFILEDNSKINYIGHITVDWKGPDSKLPGGMFGLVGAIADEANPDGVVKIYVDSGIEEIKNYIIEKFGSNHEIISNEIKATPFDDTAKLNLSKSYDPKYDYYDVILTSGEEVNGKVYSKKEDELYIKNKQIVYIIKIDKISKILKDGVDVTDNILENTEEKYIDLFNYSVKKIN